MNNRFSRIFANIWICKFLKTFIHFFHIQYSLITHFDKICKKEIFFLVNKSTGMCVCVSVGNDLINLYIEVSFGTKNKIESEGSPLK